MQVTKDVHARLIEHFRKQQSDIRYKLYANRQAIKKLAEEQTTLKRSLAAIGELLHNLTIKEKKEKKDEEAIQS